MELKAYVMPLVKYWWLLLISVLIAATSSYAVTRKQPATYMSKTILVIGRAVYEANPNGNDLYINQQLGSYYADLAMREPIRNATMAALGLNWLPAYNVQVLPNSQFLEIDVLDTLPVRAQAVANEVARQLIDQTPANANQQDQSNQTFIAQQLDQLKNSILQTQDQISKAQANLQTLNSARQIADAQQQISALQAKLSSLQNNYALLLNSSGQSANNSLTVLEPADLPTAPVSSNKSTVILLSAVLALVVSAGAAYLLEYLDDTVKSTEEIEKLIDAPIIGNIYKADEDERKAGYITNHPQSDLADSFRALRTNLEFLNIEKPVKSLMVTSSSMGEGKTFISANLALTLAQGGKKVILVDIDFRKPNVHEQLNLPNQKGLSDIFLGSNEIEDVLEMWGNQIQVITCGSLPPNPSELLGSIKMDAILEDLKNRADIVIIDSPPLIVSDAVMVASKVDGVILLVSHGLTRRGYLSTSINKLKRGTVRLLGVVFNQIPRSNSEYAYRPYSYYSENRNTKKKWLPFSR